MDNRELSTQGRTCPTCGADLPGLNHGVGNSLPNDQNIRGGQGNRGRGVGGGGGRGVGGGGGRGMGGGGGAGMGGGGRGLGGGRGMGGGGRGRSALPADGFRFGIEAGMQPPVGSEEAMEAAMAARFGNSHMQRHQHDQAVFQTLLRHHDRLQRQVENLPNGIRAVTTSDDPRLVKLLHDHVPAMHHRLQENFGLRHWDPAFVEIFAQRDKVKMEVTLLPNGVLVEETSEDPNVVKLIQAHGVVINLFVRDGFIQGQKISPVPADYRPVAKHAGAY
ncbi:MAG: hypothetical protein ACP5MM_02510 [Acidithiobacillus sp.]|uniref:hypothetical protein n=1 Tax=Acidithiobacillus sp. TaxID=1872118 RepID=UPI003CFD5AD5